MCKKILYVDMDGVIADFDKSVISLCPKIKKEEGDKKSKLIDKTCKLYPKIFEHLPPINSSIESVKRLSNFYEIYFLSTPMWDIPESFKGKRIWIEKYFNNSFLIRLPRNSQAFSVPLRYTQ